jgi:hypothetical protein
MAAVWKFYLTLVLTTLSNEAFQAEICVEI